MRSIDGVTLRLSPKAQENFHEHRLLVIFALGLAALAIIFLIWVALSTAQPRSINSVASPLPTRPAVVSSPPQIPVPSNPSHLTIANINIDTVIENVGLTAKGAMAVPKDTNNIGWFSLGYRPGEVGNAVMTGHVDTLWLRPAVFAHLEDLNIGDKLTVTDEKNHEFTFVVRKKATYDVNSLPLASIYGPAPVPQLNLITCSGKWSWKIATYSQRTVVYTSLE